MNRFIILLFVINSCCSANAQIGGGPIKIEGKISYERENNDSIYFSNYFAIDRSYYERPSLASIIDTESFSLETRLSYPHMYVVNYKSEKGIYPQRDGVYFIDPTTVAIIIDSIGDHSQINGAAHQEYKERFIPFFVKEGLNCKYSYLDCRFMEKGTAFDKILLKYVKGHPDSYVALWFLIERFSLTGHTDLYFNIMESFSAKIKKEKLWNTFREEFERVEIREAREFPKLDLKTRQLGPQELLLPNAKYTLIDFWFSRCKPCLEAFPKMKELYGRFHGKGFEIVGISVDKTENIELWQKRIAEKGLDWPQYLDENGKLAQKSKIVSYPTSFLLDEKGIVIEKNLPIEDLEKLLENKL